MEAQELSRYIDHTLLKPEADRDSIVKLCREAKEYGFASVCVNPMWVPLCKDELEGSDVKVCTVIGFPLGANTTETKVYETLKAIKDGASEVDMVIRLGSVKSGDWKSVEEDIHAVVEAAKPTALVKVILETGYLTREEKVKACRVSEKAGADFVKTSTGFGKGGATLEDIRLMRETVGKQMGVKASGGIRDYDTAIRMIEAGATRIGASSGVQIVTGGQKFGSAY
ncbi:deoxyribose-phosphate aldolase [Thermicanus aegyptius]|uniref:deoxyribose-phosphate aldolase n=1 Tax=Thermicanus aegyptius TaxID=94009 RepID=UPI000344C575|nr:deoxyribose-phosphate aldolase [Thermicanus aegyptius]